MSIDLWRSDENFVFNKNDSSINAFKGGPDSTFLFERIAEKGRVEGFEYCAFGIKSSVAVNQVRGGVCSTYPEEWQHLYSHPLYAAADPTVCHGLSFSTPLIWTSDYFDKQPDMQRALSTFSLKCGYVKGFHAIPGVTCLFTLASSTKRAGSRLSHSERALNRIAQIAFHMLAPAMISELLPDPSHSLTCREKEVLRWTAAGKTASETAIILNVSTRTVGFHINNAVLKLDAVNKTQAAVMAATFGLI